MYFPILRGRQFELIALRELIEKEIIGKNILPIIEPVKPTATLNTTLSAFRKAKADIAVIRNPRVGEFVSKLRSGDNEKIIEKWGLPVEEDRQNRCSGLWYYFRCFGAVRPAAGLRPAARGTHSDLWHPGGAVLLL